MGRILKTSLGLLALALIIEGCSTTQKTLSKYPVELSEVLAQVNDSLVVAKKLNKDEKVPEVSSIELDLQIGATTDLSGGLPISLVTTDGSVEKDNVQLISLVFTPSGQPSSELVEKTKNTELTSAISAIYKSVARADPTYKFQQGRVQLQCTLKKGLDLNEKGLVLAPIQIGVSHSHELIQTITLNFGNAGKSELPSPSKASEIN
jgi:hypothetical protein